MGLPADASRPRGKGAPGAPSPRESRSDTEPTILLVGADKAFHTAIAGALAQHGVYVETTSAHGVVDAVVAAAPDLVLLVGDAASDGGSSVLAHLHASPHSSVVPVAILADDPALDERLRAFRHGAAAVIPRSASVDAIATRIAKLAREIPGRDVGTVGYVGEATLEELVQALSKELRSGILSVKAAQASEDETIRVVLGGGRPLAQTIDEFVSRLRKHVVHAEPLQYEFDERAGGTVQFLGADGLDKDATVQNVSGLRVLLADEDAARADAVAQALRAHEATVLVTEFDPPDPRFARLRQVDPAILLIDEGALRGKGYNLVRKLRRDTRLRWTSLLVVRWDEIWSDTDGAARIARTLGTLAALAEPEQTLRQRAELGASFDTRLEITGPARLIRALAFTEKPVRLSVHNPRIQVRVDLSDNLVAGARAQLLDSGATLEGALALSALLVLSSGRARVERIPEAEMVNIMSTVDVALSLADSETPPIQPSVPAPDSKRPEASWSIPPGAGSLPPPKRSPLAWAVLAVLSILIGIGGAVFFVWSQKAKTHATTQLKPVGRPAKVASLPKPVPSDAAAGEPSVAPTGSAAPPAAEPGAAPGASAAAPIETDVAGEVTEKAPSCEESVGPSWSLLGNDQPQRALSELAIARRALMVGRLDEAQQSFCRAAVLDSTRVDAFQALVRLYLLRRDPEKAREWAERGAKGHPNDPEMMGLYGDALARAGDVDQARTVWLGLGHIEPTDAEAVRTLSYTYVRAAERSGRAADQAQADRYYRRALYLDPLNVTAAAGLSRCLLVQGRVQPALHWAQRAVGIDPKNPELYVMLGDVQEKAGEADAARESWKRAYEIDPNNYHAASRMLRAGK